MRSDHKQYCPTIAPTGWRYGGFDDGYYLFITGNHAEGFRELKALNEDLTISNLAFMAKHNLTR
jgi:hypothetical protein